MRHRNIVLAWELGAGLGHASQLRPLAERFMASGAMVKCLAIRNEDAADHLPCVVEEAPWLKPPQRSKAVSWVGHLADTLAALGWSDAEHLRRATDRWRTRFEADRPDLLVMDCAPTALLASVGLPIKTFWLADHWSTPPRIRPIPDLQAKLTGLPRPIPDTEQTVVESINICLADQGQPPIGNLFELFDRADASPMLTIPEVDPHGPRPDTEYLGIWGSQPGPAPAWPPCSHGPNTPGIFAYLKPFMNRAATLKLLAETGLPVLAFTPDLSEAEAQAVQSGSIQAFTSPIDWLAKHQSTAFIVCGGAGMIARAMQLGLPVLALPMSLEQTAVTVRASQTGACIGADIQDISSIGSALEQMFRDENVFDAAQSLGKKYKRYDPEQAAIRFADSLLK